MNARPALAVIEMAAGDTTVGSTFQAASYPVLKGSVREKEKMSSRYARKLAPLSPIVSRQGKT